MRIPGRRYPIIAREGIPLVLLSILMCWLTVRHADAMWVFLPALLTVTLVFVFRDPHRPIPAAPLGVVSPADGKVVETGLATDGVLQGEAQRILIRIDAFGTYTARAPVEGKIRDLKHEVLEHTGTYRTNALWLQTDEGDDVVLQFTGYRFGIPPKSFANYGERLGQGARCAYLRLTRYAEIHLPSTTRVSVSPGQRVRAGSDLVGQLPRP